MRAVRFGAVLLAAVCLALELAGAGSAKTGPHRPHHARGGATVTSLPYVAPWDTEFKRYSTQILAPSGIGPNTAQWQVPDGQWWRVIYGTEQWTADAVVVDRIEQMVFTPPGVLALIVEAPVNLPPSKSMLYMFGPTQTPAVLAASGRPGYAQQVIPDMLWPPKTLIQLILLGADGGDGRSVAPILAVEVYTVDHAGVISPLVQTPAIP